MMVRTFEWSPRPLVNITKAQGGVERWSKIWMPLREFTKLAMEGLVTEATQIPIGMVAQAYQKFEVGKIEMANQMFEHYKNGQA